MDIGQVLGTLIFGFFLMVIGFLNLKKVRLMQNTPTSKIRSLAMGLVEIYGEVQPIEGCLLKSPLAKKDCVYFRYSIDKYVRSGKSGHWKNVKFKEQNPRFLIKDDTGEIIIDPKKARLILNQDTKCQSGLFKNLPQDVIEFIEAQGIKYKSFLGFKYQFRFTETFLEPGDKMYVLGYATRENTKDKSQEIIKYTGKKPYFISEKDETKMIGEMSKRIKFLVFGGGALSFAGFIMLLL